DAHDTLSSWPFALGSGGTRSTDQAVPFQCSTRGNHPPFEISSEPTAQQDVALLHATELKWFLLLFSGTGIVSTVQVLPFQRSAKGTSDASRPELPIAVHALVEVQEIVCSAASSPEGLGTVCRIHS